MYVKFTGGGAFRPDPKGAPKEKKKPKPIPKQSKKMKANTGIYYVNRRLFLAKTENKFCFVEGCKRKANTVEHTKGREGYADDKARLDDMPLLLDERYWKPCCLQHNLEFENNAELSKKYQLSKIHDGKKL